MPTAAHHLTGRVLKGIWKVGKRVRINPRGSGGFFSVCYEVVNVSTGTKGFLKALDYSRAFKSPDPARYLQFLTAGFNYERDLLAKCLDHHSSKIASAIDDGIETISGFPPLAGTAQYIIFEKADGDSRLLLDTIDRLDFSWRLRSLHQVAVGLQQLHQMDIAHQDLKPSNVLVFQNDNSKVGDLGSASERNNPSPREIYPILGATSYAPPELLYNHFDPDWRCRRLGCDLYLLGSLIVYYFTEVTATPAILKNLDWRFRPQIWSSDYLSVMPYVYDAWDKVIGEFEKEISNYLGHLSNQLVAIVQQLTEPNPQKRGDPKARDGHQNPYALRRYVTQLDLIASKVERIG